MLRKLLIEFKCLINLTRLVLRLDSDVIEITEPDESMVSSANFF